VPQQLHLDFVVDTLDELDELHERAPDGHPFCIFVKAA
jgi:hypothetical protein